MAKRSETQSGSCLVQDLSQTVMRHCLELLALDPKQVDLERERVFIARIRESNRGVSGEVKRVSTIIEAKRLGMQAEAEQLGG